MAITADNHNWYVTHQARERSNNIYIIESFADDDQISKVKEILDESIEIVKFTKESPQGYLGLVAKKGVGFYFYTKDDYIQVRSSDDFSIIPSDSFAANFQKVIVK